MNILLVSECDKAALKETRRILDQFAERRGGRTWQTAITAEGLKTLRRLLRKTARKNTAVSCHWVRGLDHTELVWIVGNQSRFNAQGAVPTNRTQRNILRLEDENDWQTGELIYLLSSFSALLHDLGKACDAFQLRLAGKAHHEGRNLYRHEWISLRLFQAFIGTDTDEIWLNRIISPNQKDDQNWLKRLQRDGLDEKIDKPFDTLPPLAQALAWLVVTHHRLPKKPKGEQGVQAAQFAHYFKQIDADWNESCNEIELKKIKPYWTFSQGLPIVNEAWKKRAARIAKRLLKHIQKPRQSQAYFENLYVMHLSRLGLMLADHHYSSLCKTEDRIEHAASTRLYANTHRKEGEFKGDFNQTLEEHLLGVAINAGYISHSLPDLERSLPTLKNHRGLRKRSTVARFRWQDKAADLAASIRETTQKQGAFIVNLASTGCGKTLANARIMYALANPAHGARFSVALGLRTLTLQTGKAYREEKMYLSEEQMAVRVGGSASRDLFKYYQDKAEMGGSESVQDLIDEDGGVLYEGDYDAHPLLTRTLHKQDIKALVAAPVLVCTVDHLTPATESQRGGRQIAPMLRLMTSDLVLDEIDDYGVEDLPALARLVHWAGLLGSRVMLSSATLPPALVQGLFDAYRAGREQYQANRGETNTALDICCVWVDEYEVKSESCAESSAFKSAHQQFVQKRIQKLAQQVKQKNIRRVSKIIPVLPVEAGESVHQIFAETMLSSALALHNTNHTQDTNTKKNVSFGLIRMANIEPLIEVALALFKATLPENYRLHLCVYHSQFPLLTRSAIEHELDNTLDRRKEDQLFELSRIKNLLASSPEEHHLFVVLGSPVTEVGRDHDYDWAIVEPSSMRSLIQLVGRVRRHRPDPYLEINIHLLNCNVKSFTAKASDPVFIRPGFEDKHTQLSSKKLTDILEQNEWEFIDSTPRVVERETLQPANSLVDIEHYQLQQKMLPQYEKELSSLPSWMQPDNGVNNQPLPRLGAHSWWTAPYATLMAVLQEQQPFREEKGEPRTDLVLLVNEEEEGYSLYEIAKEKGGRFMTYIEVNEAKLHRIANPFTQGSRIDAWIEEDYLTQVINHAETQEMSLLNCAKRYGTLSLRESVNGWRYHPALGFSKAY